MRHFKLQTFSGIPWLMVFGLTAFGVFVSETIPAARADTFGNGENAFEIEFVTIGDPNNIADTSESLSPVGSVAYEYGISKYEISEQMVATANTLGDLDISQSNRGPDKPATEISWIEAAKFVNWLNTSKGFSPAYKFEDVSGVKPPPANAALSGFALWQTGDPGYNPENLFRNSLAKYVLPSFDEWYKAAYFDSATNTWFDYPTTDGLPPLSVTSGTLAGTAVFSQHLSTGPADVMEAGGPNSYGTVAQGGNVYEWLETEIDLVNDDLFASRGQFGGNWESTIGRISSSGFSGGFPSISLASTGFRVVFIPEPKSLVLLFSALLVLLLQHRAQLFKKVFRIL